MGQPDFYVADFYARLRADIENIPDAPQGHGTGPRFCSFFR